MVCVAIELAWGVLCCCFDMMRWARLSSKTDSLLLEAKAEALRYVRFDPTMSCCGAIPLLTSANQLLKS